MLKSIIRKCFATIGINLEYLNRVIATWSIKSALNEKGYNGLIDKLRDIQPDLSEQYSKGKEKYNDYLELKRRGLHAFQCLLMLRVIEEMNTKLTVVDIGDSAGTHMLYLQELTKNNFEINAISINLDQRAVEKIKARGQMAILCRAEDLCMEIEQQVDLFISFQMIEHLHNPAIFLNRLARKVTKSKLLITLPYLKCSRVGLHHVRNGVKEKIFAEEEHIFELSPEDWALLILHSGWKVVYSEIYHQYPRRWPFPAKWFLEKYWRNSDYEGFWGAVLERDYTYAGLYQDWEV